MECPKCGFEMRQLLTSLYCDCDKILNEKVPETETLWNNQFSSKYFVGGNMYDPQILNDLIDKDPKK